eukprot:9650479-Prorocentrum_lima.AAC.1
MRDTCAIPVGLEARHVHSSEGEEVAHGTEARQDVGRLVFIRDALRILERQQVAGEVHDVDVHVGAPCRVAPGG